MAYPLHVAGPLGCRVDFVLGLPVRRPRRVWLHHLLARPGSSLLSPSCTPASPVLHAASRCLLPRVVLCLLCCAPIPPACTRAVQQQMKAVTNLASLPASTATLETCPGCHSCITWFQTKVKESGKQQEMQPESVAWFARLQGSRAIGSLPTRKGVCQRRCAIPLSRRLRRCSRPRPPRRPTPRCRTPPSRSPAAEGGQRISRLEGVHYALTKLVPNSSKS